MAAIGRLIGENGSGLLPFEPPPPAPRIRRQTREARASAWIDVRAALQLFAETFTLETPDTLDPPVCRDGDDDVVLATALAGECAAIISGDQDLLILNPFRGIHVLAPSAFWKWESEHG